jgi:DNA repair protein RadC
VIDRENGNLSTTTVPVTAPGVEYNRGSYKLFSVMAVYNICCTMISPATRRRRADIQMTQQIIAVANPLGVSVHDHIIVGKKGHASLKGLKLI